VPAQVVGHRMMGLNEIIAGAFASARTHLEQAVALYDPKEHHRFAAIYAQDPGAPAFAWLAWSLAVLGYSDQALSRHREAWLHARDTLHPNTLAQVLFCGCTVRQLLGHRKAVRDQAEALSVLATEQGFPFWRAMAIVFRGWALALESGPDQSSVEIRSGLTAYSETAAEIWVPYFLALLADVHVAAGQTSKAIPVLSEAIGRMEKTGGRWFEAELHRRKGEILLRMPQGDAVEAEARFRRSIEVSQEQRAKLWELRAATSLARLWRDHGRRHEAHDLLAPIHDWFTEGFDTADLEEAKALLDELQ
jgi:predicted ATPase